MLRVLAVPTTFLRPPFPHHSCRVPPLEGSVLARSVAGAPVSTLPPSPTAHPDLPPFPPARLLRASAAPCTSWPIPSFLPPGVSRCPHRGPARPVITGRGSGHQAWHWGARSGAHSPPQPTRRAAIPAAAARTPCPDLRPVRVRTQHQQPPEPANDPSPIQASPSPPSEERGDGAVMAPHNHNHNHNHNPVLFCFCFLFLVCCISLLTAPCSPDVLCAAGAPAGHVVALSGAGPLARRRGALHSNGGCYMLYLQSLYLLPVSGFVFDPCWAL